MPLSIPRPVAAVIFDFDETMIDLEAQHHRAYQRLCELQGSNYFDIPAQVRSASGRRVLDEVAEMRELFEWSAPLDELMEVRRLAFNDACAAADLQLLPDVGRVVRTLHDLAVPLAIASSSVRDSIELVLARLDMLDLFRRIVDGSEVRCAKPDPEAYLITAAALAAEPARCVVFEDSTIGVRAAKAAGMFCFGVRNPHATLHQELSEADLTLASFQELSDDELVSWGGAEPGRPAVC